MNALMTLAAFTIGEAGGVKGVIIKLLIAGIIILAVYGLIALIEWCFGAVPAQLKTVIAIILVILVLVWAVITFL